ncbi:MAG: DNA polymerase [Gemmatimonadota bacterium]|nr:DNA polymerase [Gemmatimonadota bacterium]
MRVALRAYSERSDKPPRSGSPRSAVGWPDDVLILDTETTTDAEQQLNFGTWRHCTWESPTKLKLVQEGLFYADDLPERGPEGYSTLRAYARKRGLALMSRESFCWSVFYPLAYSAHTLVVGFNLPFDLTRIAEWCGNARKPRYGYFSLALFSARDKDTDERIERRWKARIYVKINSSKFSFIEFGTPVDPDIRDAETEEKADGATKRGPCRGRFLDLRTLVFALTSEGHSLKSACAVYKVEHGKTEPFEHGVITDEYIDYNRRDVLATAELLEALRPEFDAHPIRLDPCKAFSPAAIAKAYLRAMGIKPPSQKFADIPKETCGVAMNAYYGGRAEARIRLMPVPVIHVDFVSMYPTVNAHMGLGRFMVAESVYQEDFTDGARALLEAATSDEYFRPESWGQVRGFALAEPREDILPVRAQYDSGQPGQANIGVNYFTSELPVWYSLPDLIAAKILGKKLPKILRAFRLVADGQQSGLKTITLPSGNIIDPKKDDFFRVIIEQRKRIKRDKSPGNEITAQALKILANAGSYGISAECNQEELPKDEKAPVTVYGGFDPFNARVRSPETPGEFSFPPFAALITGAARLMLALLETMVTEAGGTYAFCDTDSMAIVATPSGGILPSPGGPGTRGLKALSCETVQRIVDRFESLNPYAKDAVPGSILEIQDVSLDADGELAPIQVLIISSKRYTFFRLHPGDMVEIIKPSEHGLGHLLNPYGGNVAELDDAGDTPRWIREVWEWIVRKTLGLSVKPLTFAAMPAMTRVSASTPHVLKSLRAASAGEMRPATFLLSVAVARLGHAVGPNPKKFHLVGPYTSDRTKWLDGPWIDVLSGKEYRVTTDPTDTDPECVHVKTFGDVIEEYVMHPEKKSAGADGHPCDRDTKGLLYRRHVRAAKIELTGKESNRLEEVRKGQVHDWDEIVATFQDPAYDEWDKLIRYQLPGIATAEIAAALGLSERAVRNVKTGRARPSVEAITKLRALLEAKRSRTDR